MLWKSRIKSVVLFFSGFVCAGILAALLFWTQSVQATVTSCMREALNAVGYKGVTGDATVTMEYKIPQCWFDGGYHADSTWVYNTNYIAVRYKK